MTDGDVITVKFTVTAHAARRLLARWLKAFAIVPPHRGPVLDRSS